MGASRFPTAAFKERGIGTIKADNNSTGKGRCAAGMFALKEAGKGVETSGNVGGEKASNLNY